MATNVLVPVREYLTTMYRPDCDYVDGEVQERNWGEQDHSDLQTLITVLLYRPHNLSFIRVNTELRVQFKPDRFRVPDICVRSKAAPSEQIVTTPPLLCIEILSPEDTLLRTQQKVRTFSIWVCARFGWSILLRAA
jgi:Uma2 family endonuclease